MIFFLSIYKQKIDYQLYYLIATKIMDDLKELQSILTKIDEIEVNIKETEKLCKTLTKELDEIKFGLRNFLVDEKFSLYFDGCSKGNPGLAGAGGVIYKDEKEILTYANYLGDNKTNNEAEYASLLMGIDEAIKLGIKKLYVYGDSQLVINQILGKYTINSQKLKDYYHNINKKITFFDKIVFTHVLRDKNKRADELSNMALCVEENV